MTTKVKTAKAKAQTGLRTPKARTPLEIKMTPVESSNVKGYGYDLLSRTLRVWFLNGGIYDYLKVTAAKVRGLKTASSVGSYLAKNVFGKYETVKLD